MNALPLLAAALLAGSPEAAPSDEAVRKAYEQTAALIETADSVEISLVEIKMTAGPKAEQVERAPVRKLGAEDARLLRELATSLLRSSDGLGSMCPFNPDMKVTFTKGKRSATSVFCFSCKDALLYNEKGVKVRAKRTSFFKEADRLKALIDRVYADLPAESRAVGSKGY